VVAWHSQAYSALPVVKFHSLVYIETRDYSNCAASIILRTVAPKHHFAIRSHNPCWEDLVVSAYNNNLTLYASFLASRSESAADWTFEGRHSPDNCGCGHPRRTAHHRYASYGYVEVRFHGSRYVGAPAILQRSERVVVVTLNDATTLHNSACETEDI